MGSKFRQWMMWGVLVLLCVAVPVQVVQACSFGPSEPISFNTRLEDADYLVKATVVQTDDAGVNVILQAESYLTGGSGQQFLLLHRVDVALSSIYHDHHYDTGCSGGGATQIPVGFSAYFLVRRTENGAYTYASSGGFDAQMLNLPIEHINLRIDAQGDDAEGNLEEIAVADEAAFGELIAELSGETPTEPQVSAYPLLAPLLITTETGMQYMLPIDGGELISLETPLAPRSQWSANAYPAFFELPEFCAEVECRLETPDFSLYALRVEENMIAIQLNSDNIAVDRPVQVEGQAFAFSANSEMLLVWNGDHLMVYWIYALFCGYPEISCGGNSPYLDLLADIALSTSEEIDIESLYGQAMWSADGTTLTYADADGVWLLDVFRQSTPQLVVAADDGQFVSPLFLSSTGRYLAYRYDRDERDWLTWDRFTDQTYENALPSPNERLMVQIDPPNPISNGELEIRGCPMPVMESCRWTITPSPLQFAWIDDEIYFIQRGDELYAADFAGLLGAGLPEGIFPYRDGRVIDADYQAQQQVFAIALGLQTIRFTNMRYVTPQYTSQEVDYDLSDQLDGEIVDLEWLPSLFYHTPE